MLKIGTVFSGIGAFEQALKRMGVPYEIKFACDNGDVNIFKKKVKAEDAEIQTCISELETDVTNMEVDVSVEDNKEFLANRVAELKESYTQIADADKDTSVLKVYAERTAMLCNELETLKVLNTLAGIPDYEEKKVYVDNLYSSKLKYNKVRESYFANYDVTESQYHWNVSFLDGNQFKDDIDIFVGGSPCQAFSMAGKQRGFEDTRGTLFYEYARLVKQIRPKVFIYENVRNVLSHNKKNTWFTMSRTFSELGYEWYYACLNAKDYGVPQNRRRVIVVGFRNDVVPDTRGLFQMPPEPVELKKTLQDLLLSADEIDEKYYLSDKMAKFVMTEGTKNFKRKAEVDMQIAKPLLATMHKMHRACMDNYVHTGGRLRKLLPRECLRLMGFGDDFKIVVSDVAMYQQVGNSIVVDVLIGIMQEIFEYYPSLLSELNKLKT